MEAKGAGELPYPPGSEAATCDESATGPKRPKFPFLRKGEGTQKRVLAYKYRKPQVISESVSLKVDLSEGGLDAPQANAPRQRAVKPAGSPRSARPSGGQQTGNRQPHASPQRPPTRAWQKLTQATSEHDAASDAPSEAGERVRTTTIWYYVAYKCF